MVAVAVVSLFMGAAIGGVRLKRRHYYFLVRIRQHDQEAVAFRSWEQELASEIESLPSNLREPFLLDRWERVRSMVSRNLAYNTALAAKYRRAARYPWLPVEPDSPEPE
jgi:hypothetical protein